MTAKTIRELTADATPARTKLLPMQDPVSGEIEQSTLAQTLDGSLSGSGAITPSHLVGVTAATGGNAGLVSISSVNKSVGTIADLTGTATNPKAALVDGQQITVAGYYAAGDKEAVTYVWDAASTATANGGTVLAHADGGTGRFLLEKETVSVKDFGAVGDGVADDTAAIQAAFDAADSVLFPAGTYRCKGILIDGPTTETGPGRHIDARSAIFLNDFNDGTDTFIIGSVSATNFLYFKAKSIRSVAGAGHVFDIRGAFNHNQIDVDHIKQFEPAKSIIHHNDTNFLFNKIKGLYWSVATTNSAPAIRLFSTSNKISGNEIDILRPDRASGTRHFMELLSTSASDYNYGNLIRLQNPEICNGGVLKISRAFNTVIEKMHCFDFGTTVNHVIDLGSGSHRCQNTKINDYQRNSGTLGNDLADIYLSDANYTRIDSAMGVSSGSLIRIDGNNQPNTTIVGGGFATVANVPTTTSLIMSPLDGVLTSKLTIPPSSTVLTIASGVVTATSSVHRVDTEAAAATDDLDTINGGVDGYILILRSSVNARATTLKDGTGNLFLAGDFVLSHRNDTITLRFDSQINGWVEISRSDNAT